MSKKASPQVLNVLKTSKAKRNRVEELWFYVPETWRKEIMSAIHTFLAVFAGTLLLSLQSTGDVSWTNEILLGLFVSALRAGVKAVSLAVLSRLLPDPKAKAH